MQVNEVVREDYIKIMDQSNDTVDLFLSDNNKAVVTMTPNTIEFRMPNVNGVFEDDSFTVVEEYNPLAFGTAYMFIVAERNKITIVPNLHNPFNITYLIDRDFYLRVKDVFSFLVK